MQKNVNIVKSKINADKEGYFKQKFQQGTETLGNFTNIFYTEWCLSVKYFGRN